jgi:beta-mannosidase
MTKDIEVLENSSRIFNEVSLEKIDVSGTVLVSVFNNKSTTQYLTKPKELKLRKGEIIRKITKISSGYSITLTSQTLQKDLFLHTTSKGHFSDNFFDLLPNEAIKIEFETDHETLDDLSIKTLNQFIDFKD